MLTDNGFTTGIAVIAVGGASVLWALHSRNITKPNEPPCLPYRIPWLGHALEFRSDSLRLIERAHKHFNCNAPFALKIAGETYYIVTRPSDFATILRTSTKFLSFDEFAADVMLKVYGMNIGETTDGSPNVNGMVYGGVFNGVRVDSTHDFFRNNFNKQERFRAILARSAKEMMRQVRIANDEALSGAGGRVEISLQQWVRKVMSNGVSDAIFGRGLREAYPNILEDVTVLDVGTYKLFEGSPRWMAREIYDARDRLVQAFERYVEGEAMICLSEPIIAGRNHQLKEAGVPARERGALILSIYIALNSNAGPAGFWCLLRVLAYPGLAKRIIKETTPAFTTNDLEIDFDLLSREHCPLLHSVWLEVLRTVSNALCIRRILKPVEVGGFTLHPGNVVLGPPRLMQLSRENWGSNADTFDPERFLNIADNDPQMANLKPFGGGGSLCSGRFFAALEIKMFIALTLRFFDVHLMLDEGGGLPELDDKTLGGSVMKPLKDVDIRIYRRDNEEA